MSIVPTAGIPGELVMSHVEQEVRPGPYQLPPLHLVQVQSVQHHQIPAVAPQAHLVQLIAFTLGIHGMDAASHAPEEQGPEALR